MPQPTDSPRSRTERYSWRSQHQPEALHRWRETLLADGVTVATARRYCRIVNAAATAAGRAPDELLVDDVVRFLSKPGLTESSSRQYANALRRWGWHLERDDLVAAVTKDPALLSVLERPSALLTTSEAPLAPTVEPTRSGPAPCPAWCDGDHDPWVAERPAMEVLDEAGWSSEVVERVLRGDSQGIPPLPRPEAAGAIHERVLARLPERLTVGGHRRPEVRLIVSGWEDGFRPGVVDPPQLSLHVDGTDEVDVDLVELLQLVGGAQALMTIPGLLPLLQGRPAPGSSTSAEAAVLPPPHATPVAPVPAPRPPASEQRSPQAPQCTAGQAPPIPRRERSLERWRQQMTAEGFATKSVEHRYRTVKRIAEACQCDPLQLTPERVLDYLGRRDYQNSTRESYLVSLRSWGAWADIPDPTEGVRRLKPGKRVPKPVPEAALQRMLAVAAAEERVVILLGAFCGLRSFESARVCVEDLVEGASGTQLRVLGKGNRVDVLPCPPVVAEAVQERAQAHGTLRGRLFPDLDDRRVQSMVRDVARRAGVACSSHQLRHRYGTMIYEATRDLLLTQQLMRHENPNTTAGYAKIASGRGDAVAAALPGAGTLT